MTPILLCTDTYAVGEGPTPGTYWLRRLADGASRHVTEATYADLCRVARLHPALFAWVCGTLFEEARGGRGRS